MILEILSVSNFLAYLVKLVRPQINQDELELFQIGVVEVLEEKYTNHWFPEEPLKGSGSRGIRVSGIMDHKICKAGEYCGWSRSFIDAMFFSSKLYIWVDPYEVSYRIGNGSLPVVILYGGGDVAWKPEANFGTTPSLSSLCSSIANGNLLSDYGYKCKVSQYMGNVSMKTLKPYFEEKYKCPQPICNECFILCNKCDKVLIQISSKDVAKIISRSEFVFSTKMYLQYCMKKELAQFKNMSEQWCERFVKISGIPSDLTNLFRNIAICSRRPNYNPADYQLRLLSCSQCLTRPIGVYEEKLSVSYIIMDDDIRLCKNT